MGLGAFRDKSQQIKTAVKFICIVTTVEPHSGPKISVVKQGCRCSEVFKMADKSACRDFRKTIENRPMEVQTR